MEHILGSVFFYFHNDHSGHAIRLLTIASMVMKHHNVLERLPIVLLSLSPALYHYRDKNHTHYHCIVHYFDTLLSPKHQFISCNKAYMSFCIGFLLTFPHN